MVRMPTCVRPGRFPRPPWTTLGTDDQSDGDDRKARVRPPTHVGMDRLGQLGFLFGEGARQPESPWSREGESRSSAGASDARDDEIGDEDEEGRERQTHSGGRASRRTTSRAHDDDRHRHVPSRSTTLRWNAIPPATNADEAEEGREVERVEPQDHAHADVALPPGERGDRGGDLRARRRPAPRPGRASLR